MGEVNSALDALAADDLFEFSDGQVLDRTAELVALQNRVAAELSRTVRHAALTQAPERDGLKSMRSWLIGHVRMAPAEASRVVRAERVLEHFPTMAAGFAAGGITAAQVDLVADEVGPGEIARAAELGLDLGGFDQTWATIAAEATYEALKLAVSAFDDALDPDGPEPDPTEGRRFSIATHSDGSVTGRFDLDAIGGEKVKAAVESIVQAHRPQGDLRTRAQ